MSTTTHNPDAFDDDEDLTPPETGEVPAAEGSVLATLRERREQAVAALHKDLRVPRLEPPVYVRFRPISQPAIEQANKRASASKADDAATAANAAVLAGACIGVFEVDEDGAEVSVDPDNATWPQFDKRLARLLGVKAGKAADVVRALYLTDGDVIATVTKLAEWSGFNEAELERDAAGN